MTLVPLLTESLDPGDNIAVRVISQGNMQVIAGQPQGSAYNAAWAQGIWFFDQTTGDDANDGLTPQTPLKTAAEYIRRVGPLAIWDHSVSLLVLKNGLADPLVIQGILTAPNTHVDAVGYVTVAATHKLATYAAPNRAATPARGTQVTCTGVPVWIVGTRLVDTASGTTAFVMADLGAGVAQTTPWSIIDPASGKPTSLVDPVVGDDIEIQTLPPVPSVTVNLAGIYGGAPPTAILPARLCLCQNLDITTSFNNLTAPAPFQGVYVLMCGVSGMVWGGVNGAQFEGDLLRMSQIPDMYVRHCGLLPPAANNPYDPTRLNVTGQTKVFDCISRGQDWWIMPSVGAMVQDVQLFEWPSLGIEITPQSKFYAAGLSGHSTLATHGLLLEPGSAITLESGKVYNFYGSAGAVLLDRYGLNKTLTFAQLSPDDFAIQGGANLIGGTASVTVPWFDSANVAPLACHSVFVGTPGILSVAATSDTHFTVTSSNALDTSTFRWFIPPIGKNIMVNWW